MIIKHSNKLKVNNVVRKIAYKNKGQQDFIKPLEIDQTIKQILPKELSRYFFFDGERIGNMSKEIKKGKSQTFLLAVRGLLGLSACLLHNEIGQSCKRNSPLLQ